jgi:hypothetical protein
MSSGISLISEEYPYPCLMCPAVYQHLSALERHYRTHRDDDRVEQMDVQDHLQRHAEEERQDRFENSQRNVDIETEPQREMTMITTAPPLPLELRIQEFIRLREQIQLARSKRIQEWMKTFRAATAYVYLGQKIVDLEKQTATMLSELLSLLPSEESSSTPIICRMTELLGEDVRESQGQQEPRPTQLLGSMMAPGK